ncbi:MAG TPA: TonB-dependent receptor [Pyrinomonadaceae bacterium]|nr:TonB-dependent receptor [Pyrinomonadaceae bacterium]
MSKFVRFSFVALLIVVISAWALAQSTVTGAIGGVVKDPQGAVVPSASVSVRDEETNKEGQATTDDQGRFRVVQLQPGRYTVTVNANGFNPYIQSKVVVEVGRVTSLEVPLTVGGAVGSVEVTAEAPVINTTQQDFSSNINQVSINELPTNGRRWSNFALLTPGAVPDGVFGLISFRGISGLLNNSTVDGGDNNQAFFSEERGRTRIGYSVSQGAIREFQINTSNYSAEYGRAAGGVVNAVTKSGTNEFHGNAFFYVRDDRFNARQPQTFIVQPGGGLLAFKPEDNRKQFGGAIGGPIVKDKLFFFFSYDQQRRNFPGVAINNNADFLTNVNTTTLLARGVTQPQISSTVEFLRTLTGEVPRRGDQLLILPKVDWRVTDNNTFTVTYNRLRWDSPNGVQTSSTVTRGRASFGNDAVDLDWVTFRLSSTLSPTVLNEARFQWSREFARQNYDAPLAGEPTTAPGGAAPSIAITGGLTFGKPNFLDRRAFPLEKRQQYADTLTVSRGNHTLKFGGDINHVSDVNDNLFTEAGSYLYSNINDFIMDYVNFQTNGALRAAGRQCGFPNVTVGRIAGQCYSGTFLQGLGVPRFEFSTNDYNFFVQDDWRVTPRLTVNLGLRYEYQQLPEPQVPNAAFDADPRFGGKTSIFPADKNNWGPRFGFAYDITGDGRTSIRGGYGIYFGRIQNSVISNAITNTGVPNAQIQVSTSTVIFPNTLTAGAGNVPNVVVFAPNMANPEIHQADVVFERMIGPNTVFSASYLLSLGRKLPTFVDVNLNPPTASTTFTFVGGPLAGQTMTVPRFTSPRPNTTVNSVTEARSSIKSEYNALVLQLNRRFTKGLQFQTNYTWSKAMDNGQARGTFTELNAPTNPFDYSLEQGVSDFDLRHRFVASAVWNPGTTFGVGDSRVGKAIFDGWTLAPVFVIQSGFPYDMGITGSAASIVVGGSNISGSRGRNRVLLFPRNAFRFPKFWNFDMRLSRRFKFTETVNFEVLAEGFNLFNRTHILGNLDTTAYQISGNNLVFRPAFLTISPPLGETLYKSRQFQFAVRFEF